MNTERRYALIFVLALLGGAALVAVSLAQAGALRLAQGAAPEVAAYQGEVRVDGTPYTGEGYFKFAVVNAAGDAVYWSNDGTSTGGDEPAAAVQLAVSDGLFSVLLGDTSLGGMTQALAAGVFSQPDRHLRVWFSASAGGPFSQLAPDTRIAAVPYALQVQEAVDADTVDGLHASLLMGDYQNVVVVAKTGGDYASVQAAIDSIADATAGSPTLVWVAPGVYSETVTMRPYVHLQGAGQKATVISSTATSSAEPPGATLVLTSDTSLRDLTVGNSGTGDSNAALLATSGTTRTLAADVAARAQGGGVYNYAVLLSGSGTGVTLQQVTALAENGRFNTGLRNELGAAATLHGGSFTGYVGIEATGIHNTDSGTTLEAERITVLAENSSLTTGLLNENGAAATLHGGSFVARGGGYTRGIHNEDIGATLVAEGVTVLAASGNTIYGLFNTNGASASLRGGSFTATGGSDTRGVFNAYGDTSLEAESITALGENSSDVNYGLYNAYAVATLRGGLFTGRGGANTRGITNNGTNSTLNAESATALGENGSNANIGLLNNSGAAAKLRGGSFTALGGTYANGINNADSDTTLETESITALGENGSNVNNGLRNFASAEAMLRGGSFTGRGGATARGIFVLGPTGNLAAENVTALAEDGTNNHGLANAGSSAMTYITLSVLKGETWSVYQTNGDVTVTDSRLAGGGVTGTVTCTLVSLGTNVNTDGSNCP